MRHVLRPPDRAKAWKRMPMCNFIQMRMFDGFTQMRMSICVMWTVELQADTENNVKVYYKQLNATYLKYEQANYKNDIYYKNLFIICMINQTNYISKLPVKTTVFNHGELTSHSNGVLTTGNSVHTGMMSPSWGVDVAETVVPQEKCGDTVTLEDFGQSLISLSSE